MLVPVCAGQDAFLMEALFRNEVWGHMQVPVSRVNEEAVCQSMIDGCREALKAYPTSINEDLSLLRDAQPSMRESMAVRVRLLLSCHNKSSMLDTEQDRIVLNIVVTALAAPPVCMDCTQWLQASKSFSRPRLSSTAAMVDCKQLQ